MWSKFSNSVCYRNLNFSRILPEKPIFYGVLLIQVQLFGRDARYGFEILHKCSKRIWTKIQKGIGGRGKTGRGAFFGRPHPEQGQSLTINLKFLMFLKN